MPYNQVSFKGGYAVDLPPEQFEPEMVAVAENCWWVDAPVSRQGHSSHSDLSANSNINGFIQAYINSTWTTIVAIDDGTDVNFYQGASNVYTMIDSSPAFTKGYNVEFASLPGTDTVIAVNGQDRSVVITYDSAFDIEWLEDHDVRTRANDEWAAGQYVDSSLTYTDDTTDAQSTTSADFPLADSSISSNGFWVACDFTFNTVVFGNAEQFTGSPVASYQYYKGSSTWGSMTLEQTPSWTAATGDKTLEFTYPTDWEEWDGTEDSMANRFVIRIRFTTAPTNTPTCDTLAVTDAQYFRVITSDGKPQAVATHNSSYWLAVGNNVYWSDVNGATGWQLYQAEYFLEGGNKVLSMKELGDNLVVLKKQALYGFFGNQFGDAIRKKIADVGTISGRSVVQYDNAVYFLAADGSVYGFNGVSVTRLSRHIQSDLDGYTQTNCASSAYKGYILMAFPTNSVILVFDPDTYRETDYGEGRVSFFKWKTCRADQFQVFDDGELYAIDNGVRKIIKYQNGNEYDNDSTAIAYKLETADIAYGEFQQKKRQRRVKIDISKSGTWSVSMKVDHSTTTAVSTIASGTGSGHYETDLSIPYTMDGKNFTLAFSNNTSNSAKVYGYAIEVATRRF